MPKHLTEEQKLSIRKKRNSEDRHSPGYMIERGIPIHKPIHQGYTSKYPLHDMKVGDSFLAVGMKTRSQMGPLFARIPSKKFVTRKHEDGLRVWRVE